MSNRLALLIIVVSALLFFLPLAAHPGQVLYSEHSDLLPLHLSSRYFLIQSWHETGELPLWNPYHFSGLPFLHDTQSSAFYPPHAPFLLLPAEAAGWGLSWLIVFHVIVAGLSMFAYARHAGLEQRSALVAALGYMYAGKWLIHLLKAGHYNMAPLAWLPLAMLFLEQAIRRRSLVRATWSGALFALFPLCAYPYVTLYAGMFLALWTLGRALELAGYCRDGDDASEPIGVGAALARWLGMGLWAALIGIGLGAVQLLPGLESAPHATRSLGVDPSARMLREGFESMLLFVGPALTGQSTWDYEAGVAFLWLALAVLAPVWRRGLTRFHAAAACLLLFYVVVGAFLVQGLPGFRLFRLPARMLLLLSFPIAYLAGVAVQAILANPALDDEQRERGKQALLRLVFVVALLQFGYAGLRVYAGVPLNVHLYWLLLPASAFLAYWLVFVRHDLPASRRYLGLALLLLVDLWTLAAQTGLGPTAWRQDVTEPIVQVRPFDEIFAASPSVRALADRRGQRGRVIDRNPPDGAFSPLWPGLPDVYRIESTGGFNPTDLRRYKEYLQLVGDDDGPLTLLEHPLTFPVIGAFPIKNKKLVDLLGVRYLLQPADAPLPPGDWRELSEDKTPRTFDFVLGGMRDPGPYKLYENADVYPRAFIVHEAAVLPGREDLLARMKSTDFRKVVLLEGDVPAATSAQPPTPRAASIIRYDPNEITIEIGPGQPGHLVLCDIWFPGWRCRVNGVEVDVQRANYLFRAVPVPGEACTVQFDFEPDSYARGRLVSLITLVVVGLLSLIGWPRPSW